MHLLEHRHRKPLLEHLRHQHIQHKCRYKPGEGVNQIVCLDIDRGAAKQEIERHQYGKQPFAATPCHDHKYGRNSHMRAGESGRGALTHLLGTLYQVIKQTLLVSRPGKQFLMIVEVIADGGEVALLGILQPDGGKIELGAGNGNEDINQVVDKERSHQHERELLEQLEPVDEIEHGDHQNHRIVREIAQMKCLTHPMLRKKIAEVQRGLGAEHPLLGGCKNMIEVGEEAVELVRIGIPVREQAHLNGNAYESGKLAGSQAVEIHQQKRHAGNHRPVQQHVIGMIHPLEKEQDQYGCQQIIDQSHLLNSEQSFPGLYTFK